MNITAHFVILLKGRHRPSMGRQVNFGSKARVGLAGNESTVWLVELKKRQNKICIFVFISVSIAAKKKFFPSTLCYHFQQPVFPVQGRPDEVNYRTQQKLFLNPNVISRRRMPKKVSEFAAPSTAAEPMFISSLILAKTQSNVSLVGNSCFLDEYLLVPCKTNKSRFRRRGRTIPRRFPFSIGWLRKPMNELIRFLMLLPRIKR